MKNHNAKLKNNGNGRSFKNFGFLIVIFIFSLFIFNLKEAHASFKISRPSTNNLGLVGHWTFDGGKVVNGVALDSSGNGYHANLIGIATSTFYSVGKIGQGFLFDGSDDAVKPTSNFPTLTAFSVSAWVKVNDLSVNRGIFTSRNASNNSFRYRVTTTGSVQFIMGDATTLSTLSTATGLISVGNFYHIVITGDSAVQMNIYINGVISTASTTIQVLGVPSSFGYIGTSWNTVSDQMNGVIDDVRLYNRVLSAGEIKALYNQGASKFNKTPTTILTSGLVGYWTFDGADTSWTANTTVDKSTSGNTGTMTNMSTTSSPAIGKIGQGFNFDGVNDYVNAGNGNSLNIVGNITISAWVKFDNTNDVDIIVSRDNGGPGDATAWSYEFGREITTNKLFLYSDGSGGEYQSVNSSSSITDTSWHHIAVTKNGSVVTFFIDGALDNSATMTQTFPSTSHSLHIGTENYSATTEKFDGLIDDVRVYNRALSAAEIKILYNMGR